MMLNRPIAAIHPAAVCAGMPRSTRKGRQMHGDEGQLEAQVKKPSTQQHIRAVAERLRQRRLERLLVGCRHVG